MPYRLAWMRMVMIIPIVHGYLNVSEMIFSTAGFGVPVPRIGSAWVIRQIKYIKKDL